MPDRNPAPRRAPSAVRTAVVWRVLRDFLDDRAAATGRTVFDIVDAGGGTGGFAVPLAEAGHNVTVVDPSLDSLAALERRAAEAGVTVHATQGDADALLDVVPRGGADLVLCHNVLEYVDDPAPALAAAGRAAAADGAVSVIAANTVAAVLHRALSGRFDDALALLGDPAGTWGERDLMPRRFTAEQLTELVEKSGLRVRAVHGVRVLADLVPSPMLDGDPASFDALVDLEARAATTPALRDIATQLHVLASR